MKFSEQPEEEILKAANIIWDNFVKSSNEQNYEQLATHFAQVMREEVSEANIKNQWQMSELLTNLAPTREYMGLLRQGDFVSVLWKQTSPKIPGEYLARLVLGVEDGKLRVFGATLT